MSTLKYISCILLGYKQKGVTKYEALLFFSYFCYVLLIVGVSSFFSSLDVEKENHKKQYFTLKRKSMPRPWCVVKKKISSVSSTSLEIFCPREGCFLCLGQVMTFLFPFFFNAASVISKEINDE